MASYKQKSNALPYSLSSFEDSELELKLELEFKLELKLELPLLLVSGTTGAGIF